MKRTVPTLEKMSLLYFLEYTAEENARTIQQKQRMIIQAKRYVVKIKKGIYHGHQHGNSIPEKLEDIPGSFFLNANVYELSGSINRIAVKDIIRTYEKLGITDGVIFNKVN